MVLTRTRLVQCSPGDEDALRELGYVPCVPDLRPELEAESAPSAHQTAVSLRELAESAGGTVTLGLALGENTGDFISQLVIELGSSCRWQASNEVSVL